MDHNKIILVLAFVLAVSDTGSSIECYFCRFNPTSPQKCTLGHIISCPNATYCYASAFTYGNDLSGEMRGCDTVSNPGQKFCPDSENTCKEMTKVFALKSCHGICCTTDKCNNFTPSSATGIIAWKFGLGVMVVVGFFFANTY